MRDFSEAQIITLQWLIQADWEQNLKSPDLNAVVGPVTPAAQSNWQINEVSYFHPDMDEFFETEDMIHSEKKIIFWNVYLFIKQIKNYVTIKENLLI